MKFILRIRHHKGGLVGIMYNSRGKAIAHLSNPVNSGEELEIKAREFYREKPDLFADQVLVDTSAVIQDKNQEQFRDGLEPVPET